MLERLAEINDFAPDSDDIANLNGAITQGLQRLAADAGSFRSRNRGGAFTTEHLVVFTHSSDTAGFEDDDSVRDRIAASSAEVTIIALDGPGLEVDTLQTISNQTLVASEPRES